MIENFKNSFAEFKEDVKAGWENSNDFRNHWNILSSSPLPHKTLYTGRFKNIPTEVLREKLQNLKNLSKLSQVAAIVSALAVCILAVATFCGKPTSLPYAISALTLALSVIVTFVVNTKKNEVEIEIKRREKELIFEDGSFITIARDANFDIGIMDPIKYAASEATYGTQALNS